VGSTAHGSNPAAGDDIKACAHTLAPEMIEIRRDLHRHPEVAFHEERTAGRVEDFLRRLNLEPRRAAGTGVICDINPAGASGAGRRTVALRADIDALPIQDGKDVPYASTVPGVAHACGHDGHVAMLLGAAAVLAGRRDRLPGRVRLIFQPGEELIPGGAALMIDAGALDGVSSILGMHLWTLQPCGRAWCNAGAMMAAADEVRIAVLGRGGHGAAPHDTVDALLVGAQAVVNMQSIIARRVDPLKPAVLSICTFRAGSSYNIIGDRAEMTGTVRTLDRGLQDQMPRLIEQVLKGTCDAHGATYEFEYRRGYPPVVNDGGVAEAARAACVAALGAGGVVSLPPVMGGEDFSLYQAHVPGAYMFLGAGPAPGADGRLEAVPHHHPRFDFDERALPLGCEVWVRAALRLLEG